LTVVRPPTRNTAAIRADLDRFVARLDELRRDPATQACGSPEDVEHRWASRRAATLRAELAGASDGRPPLACQRY
jgi:hypothetical protein